MMERMLVLGEHEVEFFFMHTPKVPSNRLWLVHVDDTRYDIPTLLDVLFGSSELKIIHIYDQHELLRRMVEYTLPNVS